MTHVTVEVLRKLTRGELSRDEAFATRKHLSGCDACTARLDEVERHVETRRTIGRYVLLDELGRGGMGSVLRAFDPQLERFVAIKRLLPGDTTREARERLVREAQAMARLVDPHLVAVFDAGLDDAGDVYLVMEFVKGPTLAQWLTEAPRTWQAVLALFREAGRGLHAAHVAGLVHRDFKPSNVLVADGVAKVTDFGLALSLAAPVPTPSGEVLPQGEKISSRVTQAGVNAGTPAYMAPEQFEGRFDAKSDQFSFARCLDEALQGRHAPGWVHEALRRALQVDPAKRFPSMTALLEVLNVEARARRRTVAALAVAAVGVLLVSGWLARSRQVDCAASGAAMDTVWTEGARLAVTTRLAAIPAGVREGAVRSLEQWVTSWRARSIASCEARLSGAQGEKVELLRRLCLDRRKAFFGAVVREVERGAVTGEQLVNAVGELPAVDCTDEELLQTGAAEEAPALREQLQPVRAQLDEVEALALLGNLDGATVKAREALEGARRVGYGPVVAEGAVLLGQRLVFSEPQQSRKLFEEAVKEAGALRAPPQVTATLAARAALELLNAYSADAETFEALRPMVESYVARAGGGPAWESAYLMYLGRALVHRGEAERALEPLRRAYELRLQVAGPDSARTEVARTEYAFGLESARKLDEAVQHRLALVESAKRRTGESSLATARALASLGGTEVVAVRYADAQKHLEEADRILTASGQTEETLVVLDNLASLAELRGDFAASAPLRERLRATTKDTLLLAKQLALSSRVSLEVGKPEEARAQAESAVARLSEISPTHPDLLVALTTLGRLAPKGTGRALLSRALALESARDGEYRGDAERAMAEHVPAAEREAWLKKARASYAESEVEFRVKQLDGR